MMAALRSATTGDKVSLPLGPSTEPELDARG